MNNGFIAREHVTPMGGLAVLSALTLLGAIGWSATRPETLSFSAVDRAARAHDAGGVLPSDIGGGAATSSTPLGDAIVDRFVARYRAAVGSGASSSTVAETAADIMPTVSHKTYAAADAAVDPDTSLKAVIRYRGDLRVALSPLLNNTTPEFEIYARYVDTGDHAYLDRLRAVAADYRTAIAQARAVKAPRDASSYHVGILNAMSEFAATLDALAGNATDPVASVALLRTYNKAEADMFTSFNSLGQYAAHKAL